MSDPATTLSLDTAAARRWDAIVIGAGPAGAASARRAALDGLDVLLVDAARFPREKVCGGCLSARTARELDALGLADAALAEGRVLREIHVVARGHTHTLALPRTTSLSRRALDGRLVRAAVDAGVVWLEATRAEIGDVGTDARAVRLTPRGDHAVTAHARLVVAASGLGTPRPERRAPARRGARVGVATWLEDLDLDDALVMAFGSGGYVGVSPVEEDRADIAAAVDAARLAAAPSVGHAVVALLREAGVDAPWLATLRGARWATTPPLDRRVARPAGARLFAIGDAAGYVEPVTGEGVAWALASARVAAPLVTEAARAWRPELADAWVRAHRRLLRGRRRTCRIASRLARHPRLVSAAALGLAALPARGAGLVARLQGSRVR